MLNILICDDKKPFSDRLTNKITVYLENREIPPQMVAFCSGEKLLKHNEDRLLDTTFLDIGMNVVNGMDAAEYLGDRNRKICIVFVTGYMDYVLEGYKVGAFRYLAKGSLEISFEECVEVVLKKSHIGTDEIRLEFTDRKLYLKVDEVCFVESGGHKFLFLAADGKHVIGTMNRKLTDVEDLFGGHGLLRVHQSYMVNVKYTVNIANHRLELEPDIILHIPKNKYPYVKREYAIYKGDNL